MFRETINILTLWRMLNVGPGRRRPSSGRPEYRNKMVRLTVLAGAATTLGIAAAPFTDVGVASATPTMLCDLHEARVPEQSARVTTQTYLTPGRSLYVTGSGSIWAGVIFSGRNGPQGWTKIAGSGYPLPSVRRYSLLARANGPWRYVGAGATVTNTGTTTERLQFRVNDDAPGNGSGAFTATYRICRRSDAPARPDSVNLITARHSGKCLDVAHAQIAHAAPVVQGTCWGGANQQWTVRPVGNSSGDYYEIVVRHSGKCLDVAHASTAHAVPVVQGTCWGGANQQWRFRPTSLGNYEIVARHSGKCLDVAHASREHATPVVQGTCWGGANQQWRVQRTR
jgi:hypothetical protein